MDAKDGHGRTDGERHCTQTERPIDDSGLVEKYECREGRGWVWTDFLSITFHSTVRRKNSGEMGVRTYRLSCAS